jgi:hypothetical protein
MATGAIATGSAGAQVLAEWLICFLAQELVRAGALDGAAELSAAGMLEEAARLANGLFDYFQPHAEGPDREQYEQRLSALIRISQEWWVQTHQADYVPHYLSPFDIVQEVRQANDVDFLTEFQAANGPALTDFV